MGPRQASALKTVRPQEMDGGTSISIGLLEANSQRLNDAGTVLLCHHIRHAHPRNSPFGGGQYQMRSGAPLSCHQILR
jgi:hypothetical protein